MSDTDISGHGEADIDPPKETDVDEYAPVSAARSVSDIRDLIAVAGFQHPRPGHERLEELGFVLEGGEPIEDQANWLLDEVLELLADTLIAALVSDEAELPRTRRINWWSPVGDKVKKLLATDIKAVKPGRSTKQS